MGSAVISVVADNIISPLGVTSDANLEALLEGRSEIRVHEGAYGLPEPFCGSLFDRDSIRELAAKEIEDAECHTFFETLCILSARRAIVASGIDPSRGDVLFVLSTTKGNVDCLERDSADPRCHLAGSAQRLARYFGNSNMPVVVSNACISGVCAQIAAVRALASGRYRYAVVTGCDVLSRFIISGFQSFKALSPEPCRPYDRSRTGLNLGEAVGTIVLRACGEDEEQRDDVWYYAASSNHNDANHISGPSRTGEGSYRVLADILRHVDKEEIGFVNAHGTATTYNDEMESIAIHRAGLDEVPVNGLKGYYGHSLGAAGIIETILSMRAIERGVVPATRGYAETGTTCHLNISDRTRETDRKAFIKILSGFGGSNAGIAYRLGAAQKKGGTK